MSTIPQATWQLRPLADEALCVEARFLRFALEPVAACKRLTTRRNPRPHLRSHDSTLAQRASPCLAITIILLDSLTESRLIGVHRHLMMRCPEPEPTVDRTTKLHAGAPQLGVRVQPDSPHSNGKADARATQMRKRRCDGSAMIAGRHPKTVMLTGADYLTRTDDLPLTRRPGWYPNSSSSFLCISPFPRSDVLKRP